MYREKRRDYLCIGPWPIKFLILGSRRPRVLAREFCRSCVEKCSACPLCRCVIAGYEFEEISDEPDADGQDNDNDDSVFLSATASPLASPTTSPHQSHPTSPATTTSQPQWAADDEDDDGILAQATPVEHLRGSRYTEL